MVSIKSTLNTNSLGASSAELAITTETIITLYVNPLTGSHDNHLIALELSPDSGTTWLAEEHSINGKGGFITIGPVATTRARACVAKGEGNTSTSDVHIVAI